MESEPQRSGAGPGDRGHAVRAAGSPEILTRVQRLTTTPSEKLPQQEKHAFLLRAAELLHRCGTPSFRLEEVMAKVAGGLGVPSNFLYTPTALIVGLGQGDQQRTYVRRIESGEIDISRILALDHTLGQLESGAISIAEAAAKIEADAAAPPPFDWKVASLASAFACGGVAVIFGGQGIDVATAATLGLMIACFSRVAASRTGRGLLEPLMGFGVAIITVMVSQVIPINDRLVTLAALILPIPGLTLTIALTELAVGHLSSGSARLAGALVTLFTLVLGVAIAWRMTGAWNRPLPLVQQPLPLWCLIVAVGLTPIAFAVVFKAPISQWPSIFVVVICGFLASRWISELAGVEAGAFVGALAVGCGSNAYARLLNRPAMIPQTPGLLILVPGTIGYRSLTAMLESDTLRGVELAFSMSIIGIALAGGLLLANQVISPRRVL